MARTFSSLVRKQARELQAHSRNRLSLDPLYYVYALLDPRKPGSYLYTVGDKVVAFDHEPFYVGKGKGRRMYQHLEGCNRRGTHRKVQKINAIERAGYAPIVRQLSKEEPEATALAKEILLIAAVGRADLKSGPLTNHSDGGEGPAGQIISPERRAHLSNINKGKKLSDDTKRRISEASKRRDASHLHAPEVVAKRATTLRGRKRSQHEKDKIAATMKGRVMTDAHKKNLRQGLRALTPVTCPQCGMAGKPAVMTRWHFDNCKTDPCEVENGKRKIIRETSRRWSDAEEKILIAARIRDGAKQKDIVSEFGRSREFIRRIAKEHNL